MTLKEFIAKWNGKKADWDGVYQGQCTDIFRFYVHEVLGLSQPSGVVGAADFWSNYDTDPVLSKNFIKIQNTPDFKPIMGDVMIWNKKAGGGYGHIAVVSDNSATTDFFNSFDQNWSKISYCEIVKHTYTNVYGVLRPNKLTQNNELQECLRQHTQLITELEEVKRKNESLVQELKAKDEEIQRVNGELTEKASALKAVRDEITDFMQTLSNKLTTIVDKSEIIGAVDRLIGEESEHTKKISTLEKAYSALENEKKLEIESLKRSIEELRLANEKQAKHISTLEQRLTDIETGVTASDKNNAYFEALQRLVQSIKDIFRR